MVGELASDQLVNQVVVMLMLGLGLVVGRGGCVGTDSGGASDRRMTRPHLVWSCAKEG